MLRETYVKSSIEFIKNDLQVLNNLIDRMDCHNLKDYNIKDIEYIKDRLEYNHKRLIDSIENIELKGSVIK